MNIKLLIALASFAFSAAVLADEMTLADAKAKGASKLSADDLKGLLPGATNRSETERASRSWNHGADGKLQATAQGKAGTSAGRATSAFGTWRVTDDGKYCVEVAWKQVSDEKWCRVVYKVGDSYYGFSDDSNESAKGHPFTLSK
jgi:uncharacterized protein YdeI (BOF family)